MAKTAAQLDAEIAEALRAKQWQAQVDREDRERRARIASTGPSPEQLYEEHQSDVAAGVFHGERRGRSRSFRKIATAAEALKAPGASHSSGRLKLKRVRPGYYTGSATVKIDDLPTKVAIEVMQQDSGERRWYYAIERPHDQGSGRIIGGDDTFTSKRDAVLSLEDVIRIGFRSMGWGGYAVSA